MCACVHTVVLLLLHNANAPEAQKRLWGRQRHVKDSVRSMRLKADGVQEMESFPSLLGRLIEEIIGCSH